MTTRSERLTWSPPGYARTPPDPRVKTIRRPSGRKLGPESLLKSSELVLKRFSPVPSGLTVKTAHGAVGEQRWKTIRDPFGDQSGKSSIVPRGGRVTWRAFVPSELTTKIAPQVRLWSR